MEYIKAPMLVAAPLTQTPLPGWVDGLVQAEMSGDAEQYRACLDARDRWFSDLVESHQPYVRLTWKGEGAPVEPVIQRGEYATFFSFGDLNQYRYKP